MSLYAFVKLMIMPPGGLILLILLGVGLMRDKRGRLLVLTGVLVFTLMSMPVVSTLLMRGLERYPALTEEMLKDIDAEAILVLGAGGVTNPPEYGGRDSVDSMSLERVRYAAHLHRMTGLPIYFTGGPRKIAPPGEPRHVPTAEAMANVMRDEFGFEVAGIEVDSRTSWENASMSRPMLVADGVDHVLLVTHAWHMPRAVNSFAGTGIKVTAAPTRFYSSGRRAFREMRDWLPQVGSFVVSYYALHEYLGSVYYALRRAMSPPKSAAGGP